MTCYFWFYSSTACSYQAGSVALGFLTFVVYGVEAYILGEHAPANIGESTLSKTAEQTFTIRVAKIPSNKKFELMYSHAS